MDPREKALCTLLQRELPVSSQVVVIQSVQQLVQEVAGSVFVLTQRFHGAIAAQVCGVPFRAVAIEAGDKLAAASSRLGLQDMTHLAESGEGALRQALHDMPNNPLA
jgi:polysaccharide pyruvyl transferase WcaK-like protein